MDSFNEVKKLINASHNITILTGAGISTDSGISDFRSPGGIWSKYKSVTIHEFVSDTEKRKYYWKYKYETITSMIDAKPNAAHLAVKKLDDENKLLMLLTQNIDGLHEASGVRAEKIIRLHGTNFEAVCLSCGRIIGIKIVLERIMSGEDDPKCEKCRGLLKPNTVSFGQNLNPEHIRISEDASVTCDLFMALGSSLVVYPACGFVETAYRSGRPVIIINKESTPYDTIAKFCINEPLAEVMPLIVG